ncbi:MAG: hypothetical protein AAFR65_07325 [Pseudomonadota bacterium]
MGEPALLGDIHFWIGCMSVVSGFTAFSAKKGAAVHRAAGTVFVITMIVLTATGLWLSIAREIPFTVFLSAIAFHALVSAWATARADHALGRFFNRLAPLLSGSLALGAVYGGSLAPAVGTLDVLPAGAYFAVAGVSGFLFAFDLRYALSRAPSEQRRLTRHLWRMGFSFFLATGIFFFGNNNVLPEVLRTPVFLAAPVLAVVLWTVVYAVLTRFRRG